jgi:hypothetical protein
MSDTHMAYFEMSYELLVEALHKAYGMPADTRILAIQVQTDIINVGSLGTLLIRVEHPMLPIADGPEVPRIKPIIQPLRWGWE